MKKKKPTLLRANKSGLNALATIFGWLGLACSGLAAGLPLEVNFPLSNAGQQQTIKVTIDSLGTYSMGLRCYAKRPSRISHLFDRYSEEDQKKIDSILETGHYEGHEWVDRGMPASFMISITEDATKKTILHERITRPRTQATYMGRYFHFAQIKLNPGTYGVQIIYIEGSQKLSDLTFDIFIDHAYLGK